MPDDEINMLSRIDDALTENYDKIVNWVKTNDGAVVKGSIASLSAALGTINPVLGIVAALGMELYDPLKRSIFVKEVNKVSEELEQCHDSLDFEFIHSEEGISWLRNVIKEIINENDERKRKYLRSFLVSTYTKQDMEKLLIQDY